MLKNFYSLLGVCGAGAGVGIAISVLTRATYKSDTERVRSLDASGESLIAVSKLGGPRCCKASVYASIKSAITFWHNVMCMFFAQGVCVFVFWLLVKEAV